MEGSAVHFYGLLNFLFIPPRSWLHFLHVLRHFVDDLRFKELGIGNCRELLAEFEILRITVQVGF